MYLRIFIIFFLIHFMKNISAQTPDKIVLIETSMGNIKIALYKETPMHTENFIKLAKEGFFDGQLFHRVIKDFMIQAGDPDSKNAKPGELVGMGGPGYTVPAEFHPNLYHKKGVVAAARQGDNVNPQRASSGSQFYIVQGTVFTDEQLDIMVSRQMHIEFTEEQRNIYKTIGGTPHLDYGYTVFGEVTDGMDVIDKIASVSVDQNKRPVKDVTFTVKVLN